MQVREQLARYVHGDDAWVLTRNADEWQLDHEGPRGRWRWPTTGDDAASALRKALCGCQAICPAAGTEPMRVWRANDIVRFYRREVEYLWLPAVVCETLCADLTRWEGSYARLRSVFAAPGERLTLAQQLGRERVCADAGDAV